MDPQKDNITHKENLPKAINGVPADLSKRKIPLGSLNDPIVASGPGLHPNFGYQGGPIIKDPQVYTIYLGDWTSAANQARANRLDQFISDLMNSEYMNMFTCPWILHLFGFAFYNDSCSGNCLDCFVVPFNCFLLGGISQ